MLVSFSGRMFLATVTIFVVMSCTSGIASPTNGFDVSGSLVPENEIFHGGPPRDGIPSIDKPKFLPVGGPHHLKPDDRVLGVYHNGIARAYPVAILNYHEIVNDRFADEAIVVSFCPLCGTGMVFNATVEGVDRQFGVSGLLYNSDMLLYDRESLSLWSQIMMQSISGPLKGVALTPLAVANTSWSDWQARYPKTQVLSRDTGYSRDYDRSPYPGYNEDSTIMFPVNNLAAAVYHPKELVIGLQIGNRFKAYPFSELAKSAKKSLQDIVNNERVIVSFDANHRTGAVYDQNGKEIPTVISFWFAWIAFHPDSDVYSSVGGGL
jgi:hypothetical protein